MTRVEGMIVEILEWCYSGLSEERQGFDTRVLWCASDEDSSVACLQLDCPAAGCRAS